jgi:hypothetical protein
LLFLFVVLFIKCKPKIALTAFPATVVIEVVAVVSKMITVSGVKPGSVTATSAAPLGVAN